MNQSDAYYRALLAYRAAVGLKRECTRDNRIFTEAETAEAIKVTRAICTVDEEWVNAIEKGLVFIEKAIKEERQFIYSNGEVIPIEKVKNVSKDSIEHLARHAELITREPEGETLIPDKLYTVERISDYNVYENRFLYMLLCYLRDFVTLRYQKILELTTSYDGTLSVQKEVTALSRHVSMSIEMHDSRRDDAYLREHNPAKDLIDRIDLILKTVLAFLATPLMESAAKAPMLKPPITKTNVLKMDNNFKGAVALYDYIIAYDGAGYTVENKIRELSPFRDELAEDMAEVELLIAFTAYRYGLDLTDSLKTALEIDEAKARQKELKQKTEQMESVRRRLKSSGEPIEAYIVHLEKHARALQNEVDKLEPLYAELDTLRASEHDLGERLAMAEGKISDLERELQEAKDDFIDKQRALELEHARKISELQETQKTALYELEEGYKAQISEISDRHTAELEAINTSHNEIIRALKDENAASLAALEQQRREQTDALRATLDEEQTKNTELSEQNSKMSEEIKVLDARILGLRDKNGALSAEERQRMTSREDFDQIEAELEAFVKFYKEHWELTKRTIRKDLINMKYIKGQSGKK